MSSISSSVPDAVDRGILCLESKNFYDASYRESGFGAQRMYPNEELCRFMGRNFFSVRSHERKEIKILETGCGSGANLWMIAKEGFDTYGIDLSSEGVALCKAMLSKYGTSAHLSEQNMCSLDFPNDYFDAVVDVFSSYCLNKAQGEAYLQTLKRILKPKGLFFSYFPAKMSDAFINKGPAENVDSDTLDGIFRKDSPFYGQTYPFRFLHPVEYENNLKDLGFDIQYSEVVSRTYNNRRENFNFVTIEAVKKI